MDQFRILNVFLIVVIIVLIINLFQPINVLTGKVVYSLDRSEPLCYFHNSEQISGIPIDVCCYEVQQQLGCKATSENGMDLKCYTSETSSRYYLINKKAFSYCKNEGYDVKSE